MKNHLLFLFLLTVSISACEENDVWEDTMDASIFQQAMSSEPECVRYVDRNGDPEGDGLTWSSAFNSIEEAVDALSEVFHSEVSCEVWIKGDVDAAQLEAFSKHTDSIDFFDGFSGEETTRSFRKSYIHDPAKQDIADTPSVVNSNLDGSSNSVSTNPAQSFNSDLLRSGVAFGASNSTPYMMSVNDDIHLGNGHYLYLHSNDDTHWRFGKTTDHDIIIAGHATGDRAFQVRNTGSAGGTPLHVQFSGNVGIGTTSPSTKLVVGDSLPSTVVNPLLTVGDTNGSAYMQLGSGTNHRLYVGWQDSDTAVGEDIGVVATHGFGTDLFIDGEDLLLQSHPLNTDGKVGIGTTDPDELLHVDGDTHIGGLLYADSGINMAGRLVMNYSLSLGVPSILFDGLVPGENGSSNILLGAADQNQWLWRLNYSTNDWGIFWSGDSSAKYKTVDNPSNPNEILWLSCIGSG